MGTSIQVQARGVQATYMKEIRAMRAVKRETLRLIETFVGCAKDTNMVANQFVPPLFDAILIDYRSNIAEGNLFAQSPSPCFIFLIPFLFSS
jgi:exportin-1